MTHELIPGALSDEDGCLLQLTVSRERGAMRTQGFGIWFEPAPVPHPWVMRWQTQQFFSHSCELLWEEP